MDVFVRGADGLRVGVAAIVSRRLRGRRARRGGVFDFHVHVESARNGGARRVFSLPLCAAVASGLWFDQLRIKPAVEIS